MKKIRIVDVATHAGVSKSTVSQYLNGRFSHMSENTKQKIKASIEQLNYVPNPIARSLKVDKTKTIGVIVRDISGFNTSRVLRGIDDYCKKKGYNVIIYNSDFDAAAEKQALLALQQVCVDGIIITSSGLNSSLINQLNSSIPIVQFQLEHPDCQTHIVLSDYQKAAFEATEYLINLGHQRICFMAQEFASSCSRKARYQGYKDALTQHGIKLDSDLICYWDREKGFAQDPVKMLASSLRPTAIFTQHLAITTELLQTLNQANVSIPEQVSIVGFDEIPMVDLFKVPITVIKQDAYTLGIETGKLAIQAIDGNGETMQRIVVPSKLILRDSCKAI